MRKKMLIVLMVVMFIVVAILAAAANKINPLTQLLSPGASPAGLILGVDSTGVWRLFGIGSGLTVSGGNLIATTATVPNFVDNVIPTGTQDGTNLIFTLPSAPNPAGSLTLFKSGQKLKPGAGNDYTLTGATITFTAGNAPIASDQLEASYRN